MYASHALPAYATSDPNYYGLGSMLGLGDVSTQQINSIVTTGAETTTSLLVAFGALTGPWGAAIGGLVAAASAIVNLFHGCGQTCIVAANDANKVEPLLQQNLEAYLSSPVRTKSMQAAALNNFDTVWHALQTACSDPSLGAAGQRCISDRQSGSCAYKVSPGGWQKQSDGTWAYQYNGANGSGSSCWNWFIGYRDPIANDPAVVADSTVLSSSGGAATAVTGSGGSTAASSSGAGGGFALSPVEWLLLAGAGLLLLAGGD